MVPRRKKIPLLSSTILFSNCYYTTLFMQVTIVEECGPELCGREPRCHLDHPYFVVHSILMVAIVSHSALVFFYACRKQLALQLPVANDVDWKEVLIRLHERLMDKAQLDQIGNEVREGGASFVYLLSKSIRVGDDDLTLHRKDVWWLACTSMEALTPLLPLTAQTKNRKEY